MSKNANQPPIELEISDGLWHAWRWAIAGAGVVVLATGLWMWNSLARGPAALATSVDALNLSVSLYGAGRYEEAVAAAKVSLAANPSSAEAYSNLAVSYLGLRKFDEGIKAAQEAIRLKPDFQLAKNNLAWIEREKVKAAGPPVPAAPPSAAETLLNQSMGQAGAGRFKECLETAARSASLNPNSAPAFNNAGYCAGQLHQWDQAIRNLQEAIRLDPNFRLARNNLAAVQQERLKSGAAKVQ